MPSELVLMFLLLATSGFLLLAYRTRVPYPMWLVVGGAVLGFLPPVPNAALGPDLVLILLLPPLLYSAAFFSSVRDLRDSARPIFSLAFGLVLLTVAGVAVIGHVVMGLSWEVAFVLGAVISPTDPVAATAIGRRVGAPARVITIVEGESLINDSTALVAYKYAIAAAVSGGFHFMSAAGEFAVDVAGGVAIGLLVGWITGQIARRVEDAPTEILLSLLVPFFAYLPAEAIDVSAVLAAVSAGLYLGTQAPRLLTPSTRIQLYSVWEILVFGINTTLFLLVGLELPHVLDGISGWAPATLLGYSAALIGGVLGLRIVWVFAVAYRPRFLRQDVHRPPWRPVALVAWNGMRGAVSLATALAIPLAIEGGAPFPGRDLIIFLVYVTILATVLGQGLTLPWLIRRLGLAGVGEEREKAAESAARLSALDAALDRLEEMRDEDWVPEPVRERMTRLYEGRRRVIAARVEPGVAEETDMFGGEMLDAATRIREELQLTQRERITELRDSGRINDETLRRIEHDLDLEDARLEQLP
jgi:CPA1 family monovalent cation:H+ antiporter